MIKSISDKDKKDWQKFISSNEKLPNKDIKNYQKKIIKSDKIDLHGYSLEEANKAVEKFILASFKKKVSKLTVITGKGLHSQNNKDPYVSKDFGILKYSVPEYILKNTSLMKVINKLEDAKIEDGGTGAFYIYLKKNM